MEYAFKGRVAIAMRTKIEGILLNKQPFKERDLICRLLLRSGKQVSVLFYGGQGGGRKMKSSLLELGHLVSVEVSPFKKNHQGLYVCREYSLNWYHAHLRNNHQAFYLLCFYVELIARMALEDDLSQGDFEDDHYGLFRVLANAVYHLEHSWIEDSSSKHLALFLAKMIIESGMTPNLHHCLYSNQKLSQLKDFQLIFDQGGFVEASYLSTPRGGNHWGVWKILGQSWELPYGEVQQLREVEAAHINVLYHYLLFQTQIPKAKMKTAFLVLGP